MTVAPAMPTAGSTLSWPEGRDRLPERGTHPAAPVRVVAAGQHVPLAEYVHGDRVRLSMIFRLGDRNEYLMRTSECPLLTMRPSDSMREMHFSTQQMERTPMGMKRESFEINADALDFRLAIADAAGNRAIRAFLPGCAPHSTMRLLWSRTWGLTVARIALLTR